MLLEKKEVNYTKPTGDYKNLKVCDFETSLLTVDMTVTQALKYMSDDLASLLGSACNLYRVLLGSIVKVVRNGKKSSGCDLKAIVDV